MKADFRVNPQLDIPIYQQLVDKIRAAVKKGTLAPGEQLPTVQEMAQQLSIARGTIKRAYDELEHQGVLEKIQGRGTFICQQPAYSGSRKERAMAAIDGLLDELEQMGFSSTEINIYFTLKQRERAEKLSALKVAVVECNTETLSQLSEQLRDVQGIELHSYLLHTVEAYPYKLDEDMDLVVTTAEHGAFMESILTDSKKLARVAFCLSLQTLSGILGLKAGAKIGILSYSQRFGQLVYDSCCKYAKGAAVRQPCVFGQVTLGDFLEEQDMVLVPREFERYCSLDEAMRLQKMEKKGKLLRCSYEMDEGSLLHLEERLHTLRQAQNN